MAHGGSSSYKEFPLWKKVLLVWEHAGSEHFADWLWSWAFDPNAVMPVVFLFLFFFTVAVDPTAVVAVFAIVVLLSPFWLPLYLGNFFWTSWIHYIRFDFWFGQEFILLEVQLPPEVEKTPAAMELFFTALFQTGGEATFLKRTWDGSFRAVWSLEIACDEGQIRFYIHLRKGWKDIVEARLYGQYPEAQVRVVDDYVAKINFNLEEYDFFGTEYKKTGAGGLPIMTYVNYGLDKNPDKPETQVDPLTNIFEFMAQMGPGEHVWFQIIMKARKKDEWYGFYYEGLLGKKDVWKETARNAIKDITEAAIKRAQELTPDEAEQKKVGSRGSMLMSPMERDKVEAIERQLNKNVFECGLRCVYISRKDKTRGINNGGVITFLGTFKQPEYNGFAPTRGNSGFDYPWQDFHNIRKDKERRNLYFRYKHRAYHFVPYDQVPVFLTTEELATLWHFPSSVVKTPALNRVPARVSEAPINLPTGSK